MVMVMMMMMIMKKKRSNKDDNKDDSSDMTMVVIWWWWWYDDGYDDDDDDDDGGGGFRSLGSFILLSIDLEIVSPYCSLRWLHNLRCRGLPSEATDRQPPVSSVRKTLRQRG